VDMDDCESGRLSGGTGLGGVKGGEEVGEWRQKKKRSPPFRSLSLRTSVHRFHDHMFSSGSDTTHPSSKMEWERGGARRLSIISGGGGGGSSSSGCSDLFWNTLVAGSEVALTCMCIFLMDTTDTVARPSLVSV
jgi:hypothetical protein